MKSQDYVMQIKDAILYINEHIDHYLDIFILYAELDTTCDSLSEVAKNYYDLFVKIFVSMQFLLKDKKIDDLLLKKNINKMIKILEKISHNVKLSKHNKLDVASGIVYLKLFSKVLENNEFCNLEKFSVDLNCYQSSTQESNTSNSNICTNDININTNSSSLFLNEDLSKKSNNCDNINNIKCKQKTQPNRLKQEIDNYELTKLVKKYDNKCEKKSSISSESASLYNSSSELSLLSESKKICCEKPHKNEKHKSHKKYYYVICDNNCSKTNNKCEESETCDKTNNKTNNKDTSGEIIQNPTILTGTGNSTLVVNTSTISIDQILKIYSLKILKQIESIEFVISSAIKIMSEIKRDFFGKINCIEMYGTTSNLDLAEIEYHNNLLNTLYNQLSILLLQTDSDNNPIFNNINQTITITINLGTGGTYQLFTLDNIYATYLSTKMDIIIGSGDYTFLLFSNNITVTNAIAIYKSSFLNVKNAIFALNANKKILCQWKDMILMKCT